MNQISIFETTCSRCGTHWIKYIISKVLNFNVELPNVSDYRGSPENISKYPAAVAEKERHNPGNYIYTYHIPLESMEVLKDIVNILVLVRDPRDVAVSAAWYPIKKGWCKIEDFDNQFKNQLNYGSTWSVFARSYKKSYKNVPHYLMRFEDVLNNTKKSLIKVLDYFRYKYQLSVLENVIKDHTFEKLSEGRLPGNENIHHHYRKGVIGDWKSYFTDGMNKKFCEKNAEIMSLWGYDV